MWGEYSIRWEKDQMSVWQEFKVKYSKFVSGGVSPPPSLDSKTTLISEPGLYSLMLRSKLPSAKEFQKWVCSEVLVNIRKIQDSQRKRCNH